MDWIFKNRIMKYFLTAIVAIGVVFNTYGQDDEEKKKPRPERPAFSSAVILDQQTDVINAAKTLEWNIQHRFSPVNNGVSDLFGIFGSAALRLGFSYTVIDRVGIGFGLSRTSRTGSNPFIDLNAKVKLLQQARSGGSPVNVTYFVNMGIDTRPERENLFLEGVERFSYYHQLAISRRFSKNFSVQASVVASHFNQVDTLRNWNMYGVGLAARYKVSSQSSILFEWTEPVTKHDLNDFTGTVPGVADNEVGPERNVAIGWEIATSAHAFQIIFGVYQDIVPQWNLHYNTNKFSGDDGLSFVVGFNMTRLWGF
jgi:hypothetical protein